MQPRTALGQQTSSSSSGKQVVELNGYVIILVEGRDGKIKLYGSPADKDNLEVADEILDVNERKLEDLPRAEVIRHIHECIQSCMIKLRVKRRSDSRLAGELGNAVQDAFVIAVEQQARERLQRLSALKRVTPVDMSQLSIKLNQQNLTKGGIVTTTHDLSFLKEASPIYVTSFTSNNLISGTSTTLTTTTSHQQQPVTAQNSIGSVTSSLSGQTILGENYRITNYNNSGQQKQTTSSNSAVIGGGASLVQQLPSAHYTQNSQSIGISSVVPASTSTLSSAISLATNNCALIGNSVNLSAGGGGSFQRSHHHQQQNTSSIAEQQSESAIILDRDASTNNQQQQIINNLCRANQQIVPNILTAAAIAYKDTPIITGVASIAAQNLAASVATSCANKQHTTAINQQQQIKKVCSVSSACTDFTNTNLISNNIINNNNLLIQKQQQQQQQCNNNNSNNILSHNSGAGSLNLQPKQIKVQQQQSLIAGAVTNATTTSSYNQFGSSNCDLLLANGNPPRRELSTLSEGDSEPLDEDSIIADNRFDFQQNQHKHLAQQQQQFNNSNSSISKGGTELLLGDQSLRQQDTRARRRSSASIVVPDIDDLKPRLPDDHMSHHNIRQHQPSDNKHIELCMLNMLSVNQDNVPYREKAVDVPPTFVARNKTPPRYPPPRPPVQVNLTPNGSTITMSAEMPLVHGFTASSQNHQQENIKKINKQQQKQHQKNLTPISSSSNNNHKSKNNIKPKHDSSSINNSVRSSFGAGGFSAGSSQKSLQSVVSLELEPPLLCREGSSSFDGEGSASTSKKSSPRSSKDNTSNDLNSLSFSCHNNHNLHQNNRLQMHNTLNNNNGHHILSSSKNTNNSHNSNKSRGGSISTHSSSSGELGPPEYDVGPHRELAVDVPDSFVQFIKAPPRYPPPSHLSSSVSSSSNASASNAAVVGSPFPSAGVNINNNVGSLKRSAAAAATDAPSGNNCTTIAPPQIVKEVVKAKSSLSSEGSVNEKQNAQPQVALKLNDELNGSAKPVPPPRDHLRMEKDGRMVNRATPPQLPDRNHSSQFQQQNQQIAQIVEPTAEQLDSIKKYQEQLRRRREEEERIAQQNDFLRASLRGSRKLQALQDGPVQQQQTSQLTSALGVDNDAYVYEETEKPMGYGELVAALQELQSQLNKSGLAALAGRVTTVQNLLLGPGIVHALAVRDAVLQRRRPWISNPVLANVQNLSKDMSELLAQSNSTAAIELSNLLASHEMEGLLQAHDRIALHTDRTISTTGLHSGASTLSQQRIVTAAAAAAPSISTTVGGTASSHLMNNNILKRPAEPQLSTPFGVLSDGSQDHIRIIQIEKSSEPLGATVRNEGEAVVIGRIVRGGAADKSGLLHEGDEILEVNGIEMRGKTVNDVCALLGAMTGTLTFLIVPAGSPPSVGGRDYGFLHIRAHFDYDPEGDDYIPCRELGISFQKGDVLHVISRDDPNWWQAYREGEEDQTLAGLIPSQSFQHQRETMKLAIAEEAGLRSKGKDSGGKGATLLCARKGRKKKKKATSEAGYPLYATTAPDEPDPEEILTYEEVALYYPRAEHKRPIVLIGPPNIGRHELRQRLMADSDLFAAAVPHTSRSCRDGEIPGQDYHFITRTQFESDILNRRFVEHGEYEKAYYGTSLQAIRTVVASGKICVLNLHPQSLKLLRASDLKPYVVLVAPPSFEKLRQKKLTGGEPFKEEELKEIIATARDMEARWGHLFDSIIINNDTERAYHKLLEEINTLEREPQWVPVGWVQNRQEP